MYTSSHYLASTSYVKAPNQGPYIDPISPFITLHTSRPSSYSKTTHMMNDGAVVPVLVLVSSWLVFVLLYASHESKLGGAQRSSAPSGAVQVGVLLDLRTAGGKATMASISLALEDFYASQPGSTTTVALHVADCKDDEITATSAGIHFHEISTPYCKGRRIVILTSIYITSKVRLTSLK